MNLLDIHHGLMAASLVVQAVTGIVVRLFLIWLAWQIVFCSGLRWRWFKAPTFRDEPIDHFKITVSFWPGAAKFRRLPLLPRRDPYDWAAHWLWFRVGWGW